MKQKWGKMFGEEPKAMVLIERDGTRKPVCGVCRKAREGKEPTGYGEIFICKGCREEIHAHFKEINYPLGRPRKQRAAGRS